MTERKAHPVQIIGVSGPLPPRKSEKRSDAEEVMRQLMRLRAREITHIRFVLGTRVVDYKAVQIRVNQIARRAGIPIKTYMDEQGDLIVCDRYADPRHHRSYP